MKPFVRTLNGIRSAKLPSGRDVAEAFDDITAAIAKLGATLPSPAIGATPPTFSPTSPKNNTSSTSAGGGGSGPTPAPPTPPVLQVVMVTGDYTMNLTDYCIEITATGAATIQLLGVQMGTTVTVKNYSASGVVITIEDSNSGTIDATSAVQMEWHNTSATFIYDGTSNWAVS